MKRFLTASAVALVPLGSLAALAFASPAQDVTPTPLARSTFPAFNVRSDPHGPVDFRAHASRRMDVFVRQHDYKPGGLMPAFVAAASSTAVMSLDPSPWAERAWPRHSRAAASAPARARCGR